MTWNEPGQVRKVEITLVGEPRVGKSSLLRQFCGGGFDSGERPTIGIDCKRTALRVHDVAPGAAPGADEQPDTHVVCWDPSGSARYRELAAHYYRGKFFVGLVCDLTRADTFRALADWQRRVRARDGGARFVLFATHADRAGERAVPRAELDAFCGRAVPLFELSAADHDTVHEAFVEAFRAVEDAGRDALDDDDPADAGAAASAFANGETADLSGAVTASPARAQKREREERERRRAERRERRNKNKTAEQLQAEERERLERALPAGDTCRVLPGEELHEALLPKLRGEDEKDGCCCCCCGPSTCVIC